MSKDWSVPARQQPHPHRLKGILSRGYGQKVNSYKKNNPLPFTPCNIPPAMLHSMIVTDFIIRPTAIL